MYSTPSANEMSHYQQLLLQQQRQQHQSAQHQAMQQQQQQLLQQQAIAQAELRSRELNIQSATNHQQQGLSSLGHVQHQTGAVSSAQNSSNQFLNHTSSAMYSLPSAHLGSSGGTVTSINVTSVPNSSPNMAPHLTSMASSRGNMVPPSNNIIRTNSSSNNGMMPPPRNTGNNMLPPSAIPSRGGVKDRRTELQRKKDEDFLQRKRIRENLERTKMEQEMYSKALFDAPVKTTKNSESSFISQA